MGTGRVDTNYGPGATGASNPRTPGAPEFVENGSGSITFGIAENGNAAEVRYVLRITENGVALGYIQADMSVGAGEVFRTPADWGVITIPGLTDLVPYTFAARALNELDVLSDWSEESAVMSTRPDIDYGMGGREDESELTRGNTKILGTPEVSGNEIPEAERSQAERVEYTGVVSVGYVLANPDAEVSSMGVRFSENYNPETGTGNWAAATSSGGDGKTGLATSLAGRARVFGWSSYADCGASELKDSCYLEMTPADLAGDPGPVVIVGPIAINNRPEPLDWYRQDGLAWSKDATPVYEAVIPFLRGGGPGYPEISFYDKDQGTVLVRTREAVADVRGWSYQQVKDGAFVALTVVGIPAEHITGETKMRYEVPAWEPLPVDADNSTVYLVKGRMGELRGRGV